MRRALLSFLLSPRKRGASDRAALNWVPAFAGMIGVVLVGCSPANLKSVPEAIACLPQGGKSPFDTVLITFKAGTEFERPAEVSYGEDYRSATYYSTEEKHFVEMPKSGVWLHCYITVYRLTGFAKHACVANNDENMKLAEKSSYDLSCKKTEKKF